MSETAAEERPVRITKKQMKAEAMKRRICSAVVACLDECGYAETSINRIQERAGVSRGALTHHFPTRQALVAETCMRLLHAAMRPVHAVRDDGKSRPVAADELLIGSWNNIVNTPQGRAFVEILVACRTDRDLYDVLCEDLLAWDAESAAAVGELYCGSGTDEDDAALLWSICRTFLRGLLMHERFVSDPAYLNRMMDRFACIMNDHLLVRDKA